VRITILYFAVVRELVGKDEEQIDVDAKTIAELSAWLPTRHPALAGRLGSVRFARNETFATNDETLADGDVVALIPPVAGG
jgi:molybdopterin converting factor subunit 1